MMFVGDGVDAVAARVGGWLALSLVGLVLGPGAAGALVFDNGMVNDFSGVDSSSTFVRDGAGGDPTTLNVLAGAQLGFTDVEDASILNVLPGSSVANIDALDASQLDISGGDHGGVDLQNDSVGHVSGGTFSACSGPCLRLFDEARGTVTGGSFSNTPISVLAVGFGGLEILGGSFTGDVRSSDDATLDVFGGSLESVVATDQSTLTLFGSGFVAEEGGSVVLVGFGTIDDAFNGSITGTLSDGTPLSIDAFNGISGSRIVLAVPEPGAALLLVGSLVGAARRRTRRQPRG
jgi:hypothetical protein